MADELPPPQDTPPPIRFYTFCNDSQKSDVPYNRDNFTLLQPDHGTDVNDANLASIPFPSHRFRSKCARHDDFYSCFVWVDPDSDSDDDDDTHYAKLHVNTAPHSYVESHVNAISHDHFPNIDLMQRLEQVWTKEQWETWTRTMYKPKGKKVHPKNVPLPDGIKPGGDVNGLSDTAKGLVVERGSRLTPERLAKMKIGGGFLSDAEKQLFVDILFEYEGAVAFDDTEMGLVSVDIEPPVEIHTVPHEPWQQQNLRLPKAMQDTATAIVKEKLELGILEHSQGPYRSRYFIVQKKNGSWRLINDVQPLNGVTIRESGMPLSTDEFSEDFAGYPITSAVDYYSGYYQIPLHVASRDMTAFTVPDIGLVRMTRLLQEWMNSVPCFQRVIGKVHWQLIPHNCRPFIDDTALKGPKDRYDNAEYAPGIRRFVWEHAPIFRQFMRDCWTAGMTISGLKSSIGMPGIKIVGFLCDEDGRRPQPRKVQCILNWPTPKTLRQAHGFIGVVVYYRIFIAGFAIIAVPIFLLFKKGHRFEWTDECADAMTKLKTALVNAPVLTTLDFSVGVLGIELGIDASTTIGWGAVLSQYKDDGKLHPARYESGILLGMDHPRWCRGVAGGNPGNPENPESQDTCINMPISTHSSVPNLLNSSTHRSVPIQTPTDLVRPREEV